MKFSRVLIDKENKCEACSAADFNNDGRIEIVCGEYMYSGVDFGASGDIRYGAKTKICDIIYDGNYTHDFSDYPLDVNGDGYLDIITGSWWSKGLYWRQNPGAAGGEWKTHKIDDLPSVETIRYFDIDNCGTVEVFPNTPGGPPCFFKLIKDESGKPAGGFRRYTIGAEKSGHGIGFGDMTGNGKADVILSNGWLEQPEDVYAENWKFHGGWEVKGASVPILVHDVNGDGVPDIIIGAGHNFGLFWFEQKINADGSREFFSHDIDLTGSQYHDMQLFDIDNDGEPELITGARHFAHNGKDPGELNPIGTYIFKLKKMPSGAVAFDKYTLDYGPAELASGVGIYFWLEDLTGNGYKDIIAPGKEGLYVFYNN